MPLGQSGPLRINNTLDWQEGFPTGQKSFSNLPVESDSSNKTDPVDCGSINADPIYRPGTDRRDEMNTVTKAQYMRSAEYPPVKNGFVSPPQFMHGLNFLQRVGGRPVGQVFAEKTDTYRPSTADANGESALFAIPPTPAKQRRTVHLRKGDTRLASTLTKISWTRSSNQPRRNSCASNTDKECGQQLFVGLHTARCDSARKYLRNETSRKRSADVLSQFSALEIDEALTGSPYATQQIPLPHSTNRHLNFTCPSQASQGLGMVGPGSPPGGYTTPTLLSQHIDVYNTGGNFSQMLIRPPQDISESNSQIDLECSNLLTRSILTDYCELQELGHGSFGRVALYEEIRTGKLVAIKVFVSLNGRSDQERRYRQEKMILEHVRGMPHIVQLGSAWEEGRLPQMYLQLEYCPGGSVAAIAEKKRSSQESWEESEILVFLLHMAIALDALHRANIAHVDFKPDNVLIDAYGGYKLSDFGCSVLLDNTGRPQRVTDTATAVPGANNHGVKVASKIVPKDALLVANSHGVSPGSNATDVILMEHTQLSVASVDEGDCRYLCSDMLNQKRFFKAGDMFSLGMSLYELMSGQPLPRNGEPFIALRRNVPVQMLVQRGYSERLLRLVVALLQEEPTARPTARQVLNAVRPPPQSLLALADEDTMARWTSTAEPLKSCIDSASGLDAVGSTSQMTLQGLRYLSATVEATSWMLNTAHQDYMHRAGLVAPTHCNSRGNTRANMNPHGGGSASKSKTILDLHTLRGDACTPTNISGAFNWQK